MLVVGVERGFKWLKSGLMRSEKRCSNDRCMFLVSIVVVVSFAFVCFSAVLSADCSRRGYLIKFSPINFS